MKLKRKQRLYSIMIILIGVTIAAGLVIYALGQNVNLYFTPAQIYAKQVPMGRVIRMGGMVKKGSFVRVPQSLEVHFVLTDYQQEISVQFTGVLPALFREGQGVVVQGKLESTGHFVADQVLAKHDENYMPPGLRKT